MRALLFLPAAIFFLLPFVNAIMQARKEERKQREAEARRREKAEAAARAKAERDAQKAAAKAARDAEAAAQPKRKRGRPRKTPAPVAPVAPQPAPEPVRSEPIQPEPIRPATVSAIAHHAAQGDALGTGGDCQQSSALVGPAPSLNRPLPFKGNNAFAGEVVAFTGTLDGMTRAEAIKAVEDNGGKAFKTMPAGTTILVVGDKPGMNKMDKADRWIGQVRKITQQQFKAKLSLPLTLSPDEFADAFALRK